MRSELRSITAKFSLFSFFDNFILIYPLYAIMFTDYGLSAAKITSLLLIISLTAFLLEIPAGSLADKFSRKTILLSAILIKVLGFIIWLMMPYYWGFIVGAVFWGVKIALTSGTREALLYDELTRINRVPVYSKVLGRMEACSILGVILAAIGAGVFASFGYGVILLFTVLAGLVAAAAVLVLPATKPYKSTEKNRYLDYLQEGIHEALHAPKLLLLLTLVGLVTGVAVLEEYFGLFMKGNGFTNTTIALWIAFIYACGAMGSLLAHRFMKLKSSAITLLGLWVVLVVGASLNAPILAPLALGLSSLCLAISYILFTSQLQEKTSDKVRATVSSVGGLLSEVFSIGVFLIVSLEASHRSYSIGLRATASSVAVFVILLLIYFKYFRRSLS